MTDITVRDAKLVQYLNEAYGKEKQLETALTADISMTTDKTYRKRGPEVVKRNWEAVDLTLAHLHEVPVPAVITATAPRAITPGARSSTSCIAGRGP